MKAAFYTLGCKVNAYETEAVLEMFIKAGYELVDFQDKSDIYVINSCMVTNTGEAKSRKIIRRPYHLNPDAIVIVMGCLSQLKAEQMLKIPGVKIVVGTKNREQILSFLEEYRNTGKPLNKVEILDKKEIHDSLFIADFKHHQRAFLKIQDGCDNFCSYCIIPYTRGRIRSKPKTRILSEAKQLVANGHIEIVLTGIHTGGYGADLPDYSFAQLLSDLETIAGLKRIRISSIEITELNEEIIAIIAKSKKIVNHLHIPLQSGSDRILKLMNRKYTLQEYREKIAVLREAIADLAITTDVIVGFPSETEEDFRDAYDFIASINFQELHVFPYSRRDGTASAKMKGQVDGLIKKRRVAELLRLSERLKQEHIEKQLNKIHKVIPEQIKDGLLQGHTRDYIMVNFSGDPDLIGQELNVRITTILSDKVFGELVE